MSDRKDKTNESLPYKDPDSEIQIVTDPVVNSHILAEWAIERLDHEDVKTVADLGAFRAFGVTRQHADGYIEPMAVVIYNWFREMKYGNDLRVIVVSEDPKWCLPGVLRELFKYPFEVAGCERLTAFIRDGNKRSLRLCRGLGFVKEGVLRRAHDGKTNTIVLSMLKHECKWLKQPSATESTKNGKEEFFRSKAARSSENDRSAKRSGRSVADKKRSSQRGRHVHAHG